MPNIKNKTLEICQNLDLLNIHVEDTPHKLLNNLYTKIINVYSSLSNIEIDHLSNKNINSQSNVCIIIHILKYMVRQKMIYSIELSKNKCDILQNLILQNKHIEIGKFINQNNIPIYKVIGKLIWNRKLPSYILNQLDKYDNLLYGYFTPLSVLNEIETSNLKQNIYKIKYQTKTIDLTIYTLNNSKISKKKMDIIIKRIVLMSLLSSTDTINIDLYFTKQKKKIGQHINLLGPHEVNSGLTSWGNINKIIIFREEEMNKLLIHELIHYCKLDFHNVDFPYLTNYNINPKTKIILNESYTETLANIINCICSSYEYQERENRQLFELYLNYETKYSVYQCAKILLLYGFQNYEEFNTPYDGKSRFQQTTSVFSYFIVKCALLYNIYSLDKFLEIYVTTHGIAIDNINIAKNEYAILVNDSLKNVNFSKIINDTIDKILRKKNIPIKIKNMLRMTCIES